MTRFLRTPPFFLSALVALSCVPSWAEAAASNGGRSTSWLTLPFLMALALGAQALFARGVKAVAASAAPLASGELEIGGYSRSVYGMPDRDMLEVVGLGLLSGVVMWVGMAWGWGWVGFLGFLMLLGSLALDLMRWERVAVSASYVWFQRGFGQTVHQVAIENIRDVTVTEADAPGFSLRHLNRNRRCRLSLRLLDKTVMALPKTDAFTDLDDVEATANLVRTRQQLAEDREAAKRSGGKSASVQASPAAPPAKLDREMMRELKRLRQSTQAPDSVPPEVKPARKA